MNEFKLNDYDDNKLIAVFNGDVGNPGWVAARGRFHAEIKEEFDKRGLDYSSIGNDAHMSFANKIKLDGKKIIIDDNN